MAGRSPLFAGFARFDSHSHRIHRQHPLGTTIVKGQTKYGCCDPSIACNSCANSGIGKADDFFSGRKHDRFKIAALNQERNRFAESALFPLVSLLLETTLEE
jgi:hypothetical protein